MTKLTPKGFGGACGAEGTEGLNGACGLGTDVLLEFLDIYTSFLYSIVCAVGFNVQTFPGVLPGNSRLAQSYLIVMEIFTNSSLE